MDPKSETRSIDDARTLPAPPIALWTFGALLLASALVAAFTPQL